MLLNRGLSECNLTPDPNAGVNKPDKYQSPNIA